MKKPPVQNPPEIDVRSLDREDRFADPGGEVLRAGPRRALLPWIALLGATIFFTTDLANIDLWAPDEPRYAAIAEELRSGRHGAGGLLLLHLNDEPYSQKPPLYFWLAAALGLATGRVDELAARLPSALAGVACVMGTYWIARLARLPGALAWLAAGLLATSFRFAFTARRAQLDVLLCACELLAIGIFLFLETRRGGVEGARRHPALLVGLHTALGAAALVKGPVGWLPLLVFAVYLAWEGRLAAFRSLAPLWAGLFSIAPLLLWIGAAAALAPDGFAREAVGTNVFARFFSGTSHARAFYYYAYQLPLDFMPWTLLLPAAVATLARAARAPEPAATRAGLSDGATARFLACWILVPLAFFSLSAGKRGLYLLPIFPALALACALGVPRAAGSPNPERRRTRALAWAIGTVAIVEFAGFVFVLPRLDSEKSPRPIARAIAAHTRPAEIVALYGLRPLAGAIPYYGDRRARSIENEAEARLFLAGEGRMILMRAGDLDRLGPPLGLAVVERFRSGRRALVLAQTAAGAPTGSAAP